MEGLTNELGLLISKYGIRDVNRALQSRMKEDYEYLKTIFLKEEKREIKKETVELTSESTIEIKEEAPFPEVKEKKFKDSKEQKVWQKEQEEKKLKENEKKGIKPKDLLTKENLKKWIEEEGRTYSYISREYVGCKDSEVSAAAKVLGIENTRKNLMIHNSKK
jgi:glutamyl/glutaminyl-tRNA synthetase